MNTIRILLADDHELVRAGMRALLERLTGIDVVAEAGNGRQALELVARHQPHVVLMDLMMPELNGLQATARIVQEFPTTRVLVLTVNGTAEYAEQAIKAGAAGYLLKNSPVSELEQAVRAVAQNQTYFSAAVGQRPALRGGKSDELTLRQREVLQLLAEGHSTKEIARKLQISTKTVETHRMHIMEHLDIHDVAGLVRYAIRQGIVSAE